MTNTKPLIRHMIVLLPGIMGSVLQKDGKDLWALSGQALWQFLVSLGAGLQQLRMGNDDIERDTLDDGIVATRLIEDLHAIPGLIDHAGYGQIRARITNSFRVTEGNALQPSDNANFYPFPYDWRRDCRANARRLQRFVEAQLPRWRAYSGAKDAQVILLGHSMGGLISRYYVERLGGWKDCRALVTFGTPHRGSVKCLDYLCNGYKGMFVDMTEVVRSLPSSYQLLPTYPMVQVGDQYQRVGETSAIPDAIRLRAKDAREQFHEEILRAVDENKRDPSYTPKTIPMLGTRQDTLQSAVVDNGRIAVRYDPPAGLDALLGDGDGTVPRVSALPVDLEGLERERFVEEQHGWLTNNEVSLVQIQGLIEQLSALGTKSLRGEGENGRPAINLNLDALYLATEDVHFRAMLVNDGSWADGLEAVVDPVGHAAPPIVQQIAGEGGVVALPPLPQGLYRVEIRSRVASKQSPPPVHGAFEVVGPEAATV